MTTARWGGGTLSVVRPRARARAVRSEDSVPRNRPAWLLSQAEAAPVKVLPHACRRGISRSAAYRWTDGDVQAELHRVEDGERDEALDSRLVEEEAFDVLTALVHAAGD
jgi:hypothetical protein